MLKIPPPNKRKHLLRLLLCNLSATILAVTEIIIFSKKLKMTTVARKV